MEKDIEDDLYEKRLEEICFAMAYLALQYPDFMDIWLETKPFKDLIEDQKQHLSCTQR